MRRSGDWTPLQAIMVALGVGRAKLRQCDGEIRVIFALQFSSATI
jgi:hypothetical protein